VLERRRSPTPAGNHDNGNSHCDWISRTFIAYAPADTTAGKTGGH
jgi:hypothetical protein